MAAHRQNPTRRAPKRRGEVRRPAKAAPKRRAVRPRYGRISTALAAVTVTVVAVLGGAGLLPGDDGHVPPPADAAAPAAGSGQAASITTGLVDARQAALEAEHEQAGELALPADSGHGRRAVFDQSAQRVWLVDEAGRAKRTYAVSGSVLDNLHPGTYEVYSRSRHAVGIQDSGTMEYFVRFTRGDNAAIGFHSIPQKDGKPLQTRAQLGTPRSHGCIRQARPDAIAMWEFAQLGTTVVVIA